MGLSYLLIAWEYPIPRREDVGKTLADLARSRLPASPRFPRLARALAAKYPLGTGRDAVWTDPVLDGRVAEPAWVIGIRPEHAAEVLPFVTETAARMRLCIFDVQTGTTYLAAPHWWSPSFVNGGGPQAGLPRGMDVELAERVIVEHIRPCLTQAGFEHVGYQFVRPLVQGWHSVRYGLLPARGRYVELNVYFGVHLREVIEGLLSTEGDDAPTEAWGAWGFSVQHLLPPSEQAVGLPVRSLVELTNTLRNVLPLIAGKALAILERTRTLQGLDELLDDQKRHGSEMASGTSRATRVLISLLSDPARLTQYEQVLARQAGNLPPAEVKAIESVFAHVRRLASGGLPAH